jgi:hypothetical protein
VLNGNDWEATVLPGKLWSLWDMLELKADKFIHLLQVMDNSAGLVRSSSGVLPAHVIATDVIAADTIKALCDEIGLVVAARATEYIRDANTSEEFVFAFRHVKSTIHGELRGQTFYAPHTSLGKYFRQSRLFGDDVWTAFPSANDDIYEAGMCLSLDRYTACVMHLMRAMEIGLRTLGATLEIKPQNDWGGTLREIEKALEARLAVTKARSADEIFYADVAAQIDNVRLAYRNPTMHPDRTYSLERAEDIFVATRSLMRHLATELSESPST